MSLRRRLRPRALVAVLLFIGAAGAAPVRPARATDLDDLRERAQQVADQVTSLETKLQGLRLERERLGEDITTLTQEIALLERTIDRRSTEADQARSRYVERAVEVYKDGGTSRLGLLLAADDFADVLDIAEAVSRASSADVDALRELRIAVREQERAQAKVDEGKQRLLAAQAANEDLTSEMEALLEARSSVLAELNARIAELEEEARLRAARAARAAASGADYEYGDERFSELLAGTGPAAGLPPGYAGTGVVFRGIASWYGPGFAGEATANGQIFDPDLFTAASRDLPFGTTLFVRHEGKGVIVVINDRGPYLEERILDLSQAAAEAIGLGLGWVEAEIVVRLPSNDSG